DEHTRHGSPHLRSVYSRPSRLRKAFFARENFDGPHICVRTRLQDNRARQAGRWRRAKQGGNPIRPCRAFLAYLARHAPRCVDYEKAASMRRTKTRLREKLSEHFDNKRLVRATDYPVKIDLTC